MCRSAVVKVFGEAKVLGLNPPSGTKWWKLGEKWDRWGGLPWASWNKGDEVDVDGKETLPWLPLHAAGTNGCAGVWGAGMAAARSINAASFAVAVAALFASLERQLAFSIARCWMSNAHPALVIPGGLSLTTGACAAFFAGAGLAARASCADARGAMYCLVFRAGRRSEAMARAAEAMASGRARAEWWELAEIEGERGGMAPRTTGKLIILGKLADLHSLLAPSDAPNSLQPDWVQHGGG
jgi:hypothetical protein